MCLLYYAALRRAEVAAQRWDGVRDDVLHGVGKGRLEFFLPIHPKLKKALAALPREGEWVFGGRTPGTHVSEATLNLWVRVTGAAAGIYLTPHILRHTALATANDVTKDLRSTQEFARHADPRTTAIYTRTTAARMQSVLSAL